MELGNENKHLMRCSGLPVALLDKTAAKEHFSRFGRIVSIHLRPKTKGCTVEYADEGSLHGALANAGKYNGKGFAVTRGRKSPKKPAKKEIWTPNLEVQNELEAMSGVGIYKLGTKPKEKKGSVIVWAQKKPSKSTEQHISSSTGTSAEQRELLKVIKQSGQTVEEKFRILEARDKLIRLRTQKHADLDAKHTVGTCPDMCPEKERLMRETQHQVALYEQEPSTKTLNPCLAVKQYSRSSADQEAPLPHELRPVSVLEMTMGYLMHKIIPLCDNPEVNLAEWYHFLWDRTRGIRKDITQQELCCHGSVALVEQCARFHIHCSARLVAEDPSVFDHKINTENLTKCLQTLKYMYHDLRCKGESCPNEAEFRGYIILLNLNDGNFMWEVQQLREEIQKSEPVQFALKVYSALDKNNYVKFFKLVKSTTYLNACLLLRYFIQVRVRALRTILKGFSPRGLTQFPLDELKRVLAFEGSASTRDFVEYYGLYMNDGGTHICLDRANFNIPELPYTLDRAVTVVESKRTLSTGEVICGGELPPKTYETHQPRSSFDESGFIDIKEYFSETDLNLLQSAEDEKPEDKSVVSLKKADSRSNSPFDTVDSSVFGGKKLAFGRSEKSQDSIFGQKPQQESVFSKKSQQENVFGDVKPTEIQLPPSSDPTPLGPGPRENIFIPKPIVFGQHSKSIFGQQHPLENKSIFGKIPEPKPPVIFGSTPSVFQQPSQNRSSIFSKPTVFAPDSKPGGFSFDLFPSKKVGLRQEEIEADRILELQRREEESIRRKIAEEKLKQRERSEEAERQKRFELEQERQRIVQQQLLEQQAMQKRVREAKLLEEQLRKRKEEEERKRQKESQLQKQLELQRKIEFEKQRLEEHKKMQEIRRSVSSLVKELVNRVEEKNKNERLNEIKGKIVNRKMRYFVTKWRSNVVSQKRKRKSIDDWPVWVNSISHEEEAMELLQSNQKVVLMDMKRYKTGRAINIDVSENYNLKKIDFTGIITELLKNNIIKSHIFWKVDVCFPTINESRNNLRKIEDFVHVLLNFDATTNSLVETNKFLGKTVTYCIKKHDKYYKNEATDGFVFMTDVFTKDFYCGVKKVVGNHEGLPIALILSNSNYDEDMLDELIENDTISNYAVFYNEFVPKNFENLLKDSLSFLAENLPKKPTVELDDFRSFLQKYLVNETWDRIMGFADHNRPYGMCLTQPDVVFYLYSKIVDRLEKLVFNKDLLAQKDFPKIFRDHLSEDPPISLPCDYKHFPLFWKNDSYNRKLRRVFDVLKLPDGVANLKWPPSDIVELDETVGELCRDFGCPEKSAFAIISAIARKLEQLGNFADVRYMMWTDVVRMLTEEKLNAIDFTLREPFVSESAFDELFVVYDSVDLEKFRTEYWFYADPSVQDKMDREEIVVEESDEEEEEMTCEDDFDVEKALDEARRFDAECNEALAERKSQMKELREMISDLEESMDIQKKISSKLEESLSLALNNGY